MAVRDRPPIILAEDESLVRRLLARQLGQAGYKVTALDNGRQALDAIRAARDGIVIADWNMPEMDGLELCREVKRLREIHELGMVYFVLLTAHDQTSDVVRGLEAGADEYLKKPYEPQELLARIRAAERIVTLQAELLAANEKLARLANNDSLTGLPNRRHVLERMNEVWSLSKRAGRPLGCILMDVDRFKRINDTHGHAAGDEVLRYVARVIREELRAYDLCGRFGGEEFLVVCPETGLADTARVAERIRAALERSPADVGGAPWQVTISAGVAERSDDQDSPEALIAAADEQLYCAKRAGRNRVCAAEPRPIQLSKPVGAARR